MYIFDLENSSSYSYSKLKEVTADYIDNYHRKNKRDLLYICDFIKNDQRKNVQGLYKKIIKTIDQDEKELARIKKMYNFDLSFDDFQYVAGVDEVGRGPLAGPIVAAAVVLDLKNINDDNLILGIKDSKKLSSCKREELSKIIKEKALYYKIVDLDNETIDHKGISWCNNEVLKKSATTLDIRPDIILSDGYPIKNVDIRNEFIIKGDDKSISIACASIIAKVYRDKIMEDYAKIYPYYGFENNVGYGTSEHIQGLKKHGPSPIHRFSFIKNII
ncbi:MAG: ribonuclease HII [Clostridiaceae bacterium]